MKHTGTSLGAFVCGAVSALALLAASPANASSLTVNGGWTEFDFDGPGSSIYDAAEFNFNGGQIDTTFTTGTLTSNAILKITDGFFAGDNFNIVVTQNPSTAFANLTTPAVTACTGGTAGGCTDYAPIPSVSTPSPTSPTNATWNAAFNDPDFSSGTILLLAGFSYDITGTVVNSPFGGGEAAMELLSATPIPATWSLMLIGLVGLGYGAHRRSAKPRPALKVA